MNCSKCNKELKDGAKFCTSCGTAVQQQPKPDTTAAAESCSKCKAPLKSGAKFCTSCGTPTGATPSSAQATGNTQATGEGESKTTMNMVKQKIVWNVSPGEVARSLKESEFVEYDKAMGLIVDEGTTAIVRANGKKLAEIQGGVYDFVDPKELERVLNSRMGVLPNFVKGMWRFAVNLIIGEKVKERIGAEEVDPRTLNSLDEIVESIRGEQLLSLTLKLDRDFALVIGGEQSNLDDYASFVPMKVRSKYLDLNMGVHALFKITDFDLFSKHYLADRKSVTTSFLANELAPIVRTAVEDVMHDVELTEARIPADLMDRIKSSINSAASKVLYGISINQIIEVSVEEESLERFRALSRELYLSEKELDFLARSNDLKNRLNAQLDEQTLFDARRESDRDRSMMEINRDSLLNEEEMEKFKLQLKLERAIREARSAEEYQRVADEIEANGFQRVHSLNLAKARAQIELNDLQLENNRKIRVSEAETSVMERRIADDYDYEQQQRADDRNNKKADSAIERLRKIKEMERDDKAQAHQMEMEREREATEAHLRDVELKANMSPQQLMALAAEKNMDSVAAQKLAESFSAGMDIQQQKDFMESFNKINQARIDDQIANTDRMERMMNRMMDMTTNMAGGIGREQESMKNEYRDRLQHQESRMDATMDRSLEYATKTNAMNQPTAAATPTHYMVDVAGMESTQQSLPQLALLVKKGVVVASTYVYSSSSQDWIEASQYPELSHLFAAAVPPPPSQKSASKSCPSCGASNGAGDMFCDSCGGKL
ncbi:MAG: zinc-ribbon domain-containing protein [Rikenellaceae bacterium]